MGLSHESGEPGVVRHSFRWIWEEAARHGLRAEWAPYPVVNAQYWVRIVHAETATD